MAIHEGDGDVTGEDVLGSGAVVGEVSAIDLRFDPVLLKLASMILRNSRFTGLILCVLCCPD